MYYQGSPYHTPYFPHPTSAHHNPYGQEQWGNPAPAESMNRQQVPQVPQITWPFLTPEGFLPLEVSYIENILRFNRGKMARLYFTYENNPEWPAQVYTGRIEEAGRDHIIISDPETGKSYLLLMVNLDYVEFDEPIEYIPPMVPSPPIAQRPVPQVPRPRM
ncbi:spore germination protein Q [Caldalkalibacillus uzonensis]|uniref:Spore germination protein Q n=1 Tax=Caldalkalibacillus uzonensis TaxID=353224 RepID=A0ABU0CPT1_9BACI|nr:spore coat protein GerQ [Caldalkalibacillus uzonensis]MDQ0337515.1 spore germination protein Q [Caldalkalibacillus uzonensis]